MQMKYCAYSYLDESSSLCDYEVATDKLASLTALCAHYVKVIDSDDLQLLTSMIYHANGSIRRNCAITQEDMQQLERLYEKYYVEMKCFVLPGGSLQACWLHTLRTETKVVIRCLNAVKQEGIPVNPILWDFMNFLSNIIFMMCLYENQQADTEEIVFESKSYACTKS